MLEAQLHSLQTGHTMLTPSCKLNADLWLQFMQAGSIQCSRSYSAAKTVDPGVAATPARGLHSLMLHSYIIPITSCQLSRMTVSITKEIIVCV